MWTALLAAPVWAQDFETFTLSGNTFAGEGALELAQPWVGDRGAFYTGLGMTYAKDAVVAYQGEERFSLIPMQLGLRLGAGYTVADLARLDLELPVFPVVQADAVALRDLTQVNLTTGPEGAASLGNPRIGATVEVFHTGLVSVAVVPVIELPLASADSFLSNGPGGGLSAAVGSSLDVGVPLKVWGDLGLFASTSEEFVDIQLGTRLPYGAGVAAGVADGVWLGAEAEGALDVAGGLGGLKHPLEGSGFATASFGPGLNATLGVTGGMAPALGSPQVRAFVGIGYAAGKGAGKPDGTDETGVAAGPADDTDGDGIKNNLDACPDKREDRDKFEDEDGCPEGDNDKDGLLDQLDQCPLEAEDTDGYRDEDGCSDPDNDFDTLLDADDGCPDLAGDPSMGGCPDSDGDGLLDPDDQCPKEAGDFSKMGCP